MVALRGRVDNARLYLWAAFISVAMIARTIMCQALRARIESCPIADLPRYERYLFASAVVNAIAAGSAFSSSRVTAISPSG